MKTIIKKEPIEVEKEYFVAEDGKEFETPLQCLAYENSYCTEDDEYKALEAYNEQLFKELNSAYEGFIKLTNENFSLKIENQELKTRKLTFEERLFGKRICSSKNTEEMHMKLSKATVYCFDAKLEYLDEYKEEKGECFIVPFQVLAEDQYKARGMLEEWLSVPEQTGYKFKQCVGLDPKPSETLIMLDKQEDEQGE